MCKEENETQHLPSHVVLVRHLGFINHLADLGRRFYRTDPQAYQPYNKDWVNEKTPVPPSPTPTVWEVIQLEARESGATWSRQSKL